VLCCVCTVCGRECSETVWESWLGGRIVLAPPRIYLLGCAQWTLPVCPNACSLLICAKNPRDRDTNSVQEAVVQHILLGHHKQMVSSCAAAYALCVAADAASLFGRVGLGEGLSWPLPAYTLPEYARSWFSLRGGRGQGSQGTPRKYPSPAYTVRRIRDGGIQLNGANPHTPLCRALLRMQRDCLGELAWGAGLSWPLPAYTPLDVHAVPHAGEGRLPGRTRPMSTTGP
jgi:hypothetical protein